MDSLIRVRTELFNYRDVKPNFINHCCFGEDFASWLKERILPLEESGFTISEIIQEDYGWGFWAREGKNSFWVAVNCVGNRPDEYGGEWGVFISYDPGLDLFKRLFHKPDQHSFDKLRIQIRQALESDPAMNLAAN